MHMIISEFKRIADKENGEFYFSDGNISLTGGVHSPDVEFIIKFVYQGCEVVIINKTGYNYYGNVISKFKATKTSLGFDLYTKSHFARLFSRKKEQFKIESIDENLNHLLNKSPALKELAKIAKNTVFEPMIIGTYVNDYYELRTEYHLQFSNWTQVLEPLIAFYKEFIDTFMDRSASNL